MREGFEISIDGVAVAAQPGQTVLQVAEAAGIYIPRLCDYKGVSAHGSCRVCTVRVDGRHQASCTWPVSPGMQVEHDTAELRDQRAMIVELLFVEGNHYCMACEKSGNCQLQGLAYRMGIAAPRFDYIFPLRGVDASHPHVYLDHNRCVLCARCIRASEELDHKDVFKFVGRGPDKKIAVNAVNGLGDTDLVLADAAVDACPVGAILHKTDNYRVPIGQRLYDEAAIGTEVQARDKAQ